MRWLYLVTRCSLLSCSLLSCSAQDAGSASEGGQTGSLLPPECSVPAASDLQVSEGDTAFVAYVPPGAVVDVRLLDSEQQPVELTFEQIDSNDNAQVARSSEALTTGRYQLVYRCTTALGPVEFDAPLTVVPAETPPTTLGTLVPDFELAETRQCGSLLRFWLELTPQAISYQQLIQLEISIGDQQRFTVVPFGTLRSQEGRVELVLQHCDGEALPTCIPSGPSTLRVHAQVAGEAIDVEAASLELDAKCRTVEEDELSCTVRGAPSHAPGWVGWLGVLLALPQLRKLARHL